MILADKILNLRKKNGWSQEEFAHRLNVTRQSVSKWEGAQSVPDLDKIVQMSEIFNVSTDYLLKDEIESQERAEEKTEEVKPSNVRKISLAEAKDFLDIKGKTSKTISFATFLCIISPIPLLTLLAFSILANPPISENKACGLGIIALLLFVTAAVALFITSGMKTKPYEFLDSGNYETEYGVSEMVSERKKQYRNTYTRSVVTGTCICILSVIPILAAALLVESGFYAMLAVCATLFIVAVGVQFLLVTGIRWASFEKLLHEGDYAKDRSGLKDTVSGIYWMIVTAVFLAYSFITNDWGHSWIIWPVMGVLYAVVAIVCDVIANKNKK